MAGFNCVILGGYLTRDPSLKETKNGYSVCHCGMAVNKPRKDGQEKTMFIDLTFFGNTAEAVNNFFHKGKEIIVRGELQHERWEDEEGNRRSKHSLICNEFSFCGKKGDDVPVGEPKDETEPDDQVPF